MKFAIGALFVSLCSAHSMNQSAVLLDFTGEQVHVELQLPQSRVATLFGAQPPDTQYVLSRVAAPPFAVRLAAPPTLERVDGAPYWIVRLLLTLPPGQPVPASFQLTDNALLDRIPAQVALVSIRSDWAQSVFANDPQLIGVLRGGGAHSIQIDRTGGSWFNGFASIFKLGVRHIAEGTDHLLFLLALLLPAPLLWTRTRWCGPATVRESLLRIVKVVTAFTLGHSITLAMAALGVVRVPSRPIEALIAVSILISAIHALRPLFPGREAAIAAFFGLIHGLAFASTLGELGLGRWERVTGILAFNLGIEAMQLIVVIAAMPSFLLLSRTTAYAPLRKAGALFAAAAATGWIVERLFDIHTPVDFVVDSMAQQAVWIAGALLLFSVVLWRVSLRADRASSLNSGKSSCHRLSC